MLEIGFKMLPMLQKSCPMLKKSCSMLKKSCPMLQKSCPMLSPMLSLMLSPILSPMLSPMLSPIPTLSSPCPAVHYPRDPRDPMPRGSSKQTQLCTSAMGGGFLTGGL